VITNRAEIASHTRLPSPDLLCKIASKNGISGSRSFLEMIRYPHGVPLVIQSAGTRRSSVSGSLSEACFALPAATKLTNPSLSSPDYAISHNNTARTTPELSIPALPSHFSPTYNHIDPTLPTPNTPPTQHTPYHKPPLSHQPNKQLQPNHPPWLSAQQPAQ